MSVKNPKIERFLGHKKSFIVMKKRKDESPLRIVTLFLAGGFLGWLLDTSYRSITEHAFSHAGYLEALTGITIPFLPVYGFGTLLIYFIRTEIRRKNIITKLAVYGISLTLLEFVAGIFTALTLQKPLWDYSASTYNYLGIIDGTHTLFWIVLALIAEEMIEWKEKKHAGK